jgi:hypothetical protein
VLAIALSSNWAMSATLSLLVFALVVPPPHLLKQSLAIKCAKEFAHETKVFAFLVLALKSLETICVLQALHPSNLNSPCSNSLIDFQHDTSVKLSMNSFRSVFLCMSHLSTCGSLNMVFELFEKNLTPKIQLVVLFGFIS